VEHESRKKWFVDREEGCSYKTPTTYNQVLSEALRITCNINEQSEFIKSLEGTRTPLILGDVVRLEIPHKPRGIPAEYFIRTETDWSKFDGNTIQLLKHFR
jgi:hypothetical protein